jgi:hypothetical protein
MAVGMPDRETVRAMLNQSGNRLDKRDDPVMMSG